MAIKIETKLGCRPDLMKKTFKGLLKSLKELKKLKVSDTGFGFEIVHENNTIYIHEDMFKNFGSWHMFNYQDGYYRINDDRINWIYTTEMFEIIEDFDNQLKDLLNE